MKVLVTGSRDWSNREMIEKALVEADATIVVHGGARGADYLAELVCIDLGITTRTYPAKWDLYGKAAGTNRNIEMLQKENLLDEPIDLVIGFPLPQSKGTYHMLKIAANAGIPCIIVGDPMETKCTRCRREGFDDLVSSCGWVCTDCFETLWKLANGFPTTREERTELCAICKKAITDDEWVVNWTYCADCFDKNYQDYLDSQDLQTEPITC